MKAGSSIILPCTCVSAFQDDVYGRGMRVHNIGKRAGSGSQRIARCTVCMDIKQVKDDTDERGWQNDHCGRSEARH